MTTSNLLKVEGAAWTVAAEVEQQISSFKTSEEIIRSRNLDYNISQHNLMTDVQDPVPDFYAMYRDDNNMYLGSVLSKDPIVTQNIDSFVSIDPLLQDGTLTPVIADSYKNGRQIFGVFKMNEKFDVLGDQFNQYFIIVNDHLKPDGHVQVVNTPIRIACMNAYSSALSRANLKFKIPVFGDYSTEQISTSIMNAYERTADAVVKTAEDLAAIKISKVGVAKLLDELFPYLDDSSESTNHDRANQAIDAQREAFVVCMNEDNLQNFQGTMYQVWSALTDYTQHYHRDSRKGFNLQNRMALLPGVDPEATNDSLKVTKFLKNIDKFAARRQEKKVA